jgi:limonene 1,2-monooxygenase
MCAEQIDRLMKQSNGGFGAYLLLAHNWANPAATLRSYELIAREVMPRFQGHAHPTIEAAQRAEAARPELAAVHAKAVETARERYAAEKTSQRPHRERTVFDHEFGPGLLSGAGLFRCVRAGSRFPPGA